MDANTKFRALLDLFAKIVDSEPKPDEAAEKLNSLKDMAKQSGNMTSRQVDAILARCDNYLKGEYGNTKTAEHFGHSKPEKK